MIVIFKYYWIDDVAGIAVAVMLLLATFKLTRDALHVLLEGVPTSIKIKDVKASLLSLTGVKALGDVHAWTIDHENYAFSCHLVIDYSGRTTSHEIVKEARSILHETYGFTHTTIEVRLV
jgi:cobalt-zinc-cadmium efflux system protein